MFWQQFLANYLSSVLAAITIGALGGGVYLCFRSKNISKQRQNIKQITNQGDNINIGIGQVVVSDTKNSTTAKKNEDIIKKYDERQN